jgi:ParB-like chromosome segregation protein Spo0J
MPAREGGEDVTLAAPPRTAAPRVVDIAIGDIRDRGWRDRVEASDPAHRALLASVRSRGVLVPLVVRAHPAGGYQLVSGARRLQVAREAGHRTVPVVVRELGEAEALIGGAWAPLTRSGVSDEEAVRLREQLVAAGVPAGDAGLLADSLPRVGGVELRGRPSPRTAGGAAPQTRQPRR